MKHIVIVAVAGEYEGSIKGPVINTDTHNGLTSAVPLDNFVRDLEAETLAMFQKEFNISNCATTTEILLKN